MPGKKRWSLVIINLLSALLVLVGCGNGNSNSPEPAAGSSSSTSVEPSSTGQKDLVTLKVLSSSQTEQPGGEVEKGFAEAYMKQNPNVKIEFIAVPANELWPKVTAMATGGDMPDIFINTHDYYLQAYEMGIAADLNELLGKEFFDRFYPNTLAESGTNGVQVFMPFETMPFGMLYRIDWFEEAGIQPPKTWDDFLKAAQMFTKDINGDGTIDQWGFGMVGTNNQSGAARFMQVIRTFGAAEIMEENGRWETELDSPESVQAFQFFSNLDAKYKVVPPGAIQTGFTETVSAFASNKIAMTLSGPQAIGMILAQNPGLKDKIGGVPVPMQTEHATRLNLLGYSIASASEHKEEAADFLKFLVSKENQIKWSEETYFLPALKEAGEDPEIQSNPALAGFINVLNYVYPKPTFSGYPAVHSIIAEAFQSVLVGQATAEEAAKSAAGKVREEIKKSS